MKKALVVLLAVALVFSFATTAFAFTDISAEKAATQSAINRFAAYGVVNGYDDGTFLPGGTITRAEFAKIVIAYTGNEVLAESLKNVASQFSDVKTGEWYTGWINAAVALGYFQGMGDGSFGVSKTVTYGQVVTVLLRLAGYTDALAGAWPYNYVAQATKANIGLVQAATAFDATAPATRKDVVLMASKLLDVSVVAYNETSKIFATVTDNNNHAITVGAANGVFVTEANDTPLTVAYNTNKKALTVANKVMSENFGISDGFTLFDLACLEFEDKSLVGKIMVNDKDEIVFVELGGKYVKGVAAYKGTPKVFTVDGVEYKLADSFATTDATSANGKYVYVTLADKKVAEIVERPVIGGDVITKAKADGKGFETTGTGITTVEKNKVFTVFKDGALASVEDIAVGDLVFDATEDLIANDHYTYIVTSPVGAAAISGVNSEDGDAIASFVIDGVTYTGAPKYIVGTAVDPVMNVEEYAKGKFKGLEGVLYKDAFGYFAYMAYDQADVTTSTVIGAIMDGTAVQNTAGGASIGTGNAAAYVGYSDLTVLTTKGETVKYDVDSKKYADLFDVDGTTIKTKTGAATIVKGLFVELTLDENQVVVGLKPVALGNAVKVDKVDTKYNTVTFVGGAIINTPAATPVFMVTTKTGKVTNVEVVDFSTLGAGLKDKDVKYVAKNSAMTYMVVEDYTAVETVETYAVLKSLYQDGSNVQFEDGSVFAKTSTFNANNAVVGDIVSYVLKDGKIDSLSVKKAKASISAAAITGVSGSVVTTATKTYVVDADVLVYIYKDGKFVEMGTAADLVKDAKIDAFDLKDNVIIKQVIIDKTVAQE